MPLATMRTLRMFSAVSLEYILPSKVSVASLLSPSGSVVYVVPSAETLTSELRCSGFR